MSKIRVNQETVLDVLKNDAHLGQDEAIRVFRKLEIKASEEAESDKLEKEPTIKKQFAVVLYDKSGDLFGNENLTATVIQVPDDDDLALALPRIHAAAYEFNISKNGRKCPVNTVGEACEAVGPRFFKPQGVWVKTKVPVRVIVSDNKIQKIEEDLA